MPCNSIPIDRHKINRFIGTIGSIGARTQSVQVSAVVITLQHEARRRGLTAYRLSKDTGLRIDTMQRLLAGKGSPTISTLESVARVMGMVIAARHVS